MNLKPLSLLFLLLLTSSLHAAITIDGAVNHNAVLQRSHPIPLWGTANDGDHIQITFANQHITTIAKNGQWSVRLPSLPAGGPFNLTITSDHDSLTYTNLLVGDVWLISGQSNMSMPVKECDDSEQSATNIAHPNLRLGFIKKSWNGQPRTDFETNCNWQACTPDTARDFSAVGYFFANELLKDPALANVPIGLIDSSLGGTMCEAWIPQSAWGRLDTNMLHDSMFGIKPATLYNAMIAPFAQAPLTGVIWYQGEGNAGQPAYYPTLLTTLIGEWRHQFQQPKLPFFIVQLPDYLPDWGGYYWTWIRETQAKTVQAVPHTSLIVGIETADGTNLHPKQKQEIGRRAALQARHVVYREAITATGPIFKKAKVKGSTIEVTFTTAGSALTNNSTNDLQGFTLAGADGVYHPATAKIEGTESDIVIVGSTEVAAPKTVRYAWSGVPHSTLRNQAGLPAAPFRTDTLPPDRVEAKK